MAPVEIFPGVYVLPLGPVNVFFLRDGDGLTLLDAGNAGDEQAILAGARAIADAPGGIRQIVLTHGHPDHAGSLAALLRTIDAPVWMHHLDAEVVRGHAPLAPMRPGPGLFNWFLYNQIIRNSTATIAPAQVDHEVADGDLLPIGRGLRVYHTPGHSAGHLAFLLESDGGLLFAGDTCRNMPRMYYSIGYEDRAVGRHSLARLAGLRFAAVCFGHGRALSGSAATRFNRMWA
ncbi:MAG TPA: MBL fold metallo-hydrolase [Kouleothrix sp.]|uniref:MBL fold metallo-hydrolase n=1 Tax=Kouleothrix sp. TaxID=2779161 RepID=UPI002BC22D6B|nr:MBL fold metallo-hydrolase [Kouleothrix sp.]